MSKLDLSIRYTKDFIPMVRIVFFNTIGFFFLDFLMPIIVYKELNATGLEIGLLFSAQVLGYMSSSFLVGFLTDRVKSRTRLIIIGSFGRGSAYFILYIAFIMNSLIGVAIGRLFLGLLAGFFWIPFDTLVAEKTNKKYRSHAFGRRNLSMGLGTMVGSFIGFPIYGLAISYNLHKFITYIAIPIFGISNFFAGIQFYRKVDETIKFYDKDTREKLDDFEKRKYSVNQKAIFFGLIFLTIVLLLANINYSIGSPFFTVYILEEIVNNELIALLAFIPSGFLSLFLAPKLGELADKVNPYLAISVSSMLGAIITLFLINSNNIWIFAILLVFDSTIITVGGLAFENFLSRISIKQRGKIMGLRSFFVNFGALIGPFLGGLAWDNLGNQWPFLISIIVELGLIPFYVFSVFLLKPYLIEEYDLIEKLDVSHI